MAQTSFAMDLTNFAKAWRERADFAVREIMIALSSNVIYRSPVKTGLFRGNWQLGVGDSPAALLDFKDKLGDATLQRVVAVIPEQAAGKVYYLRNNTVYGPLLEDGYSAQAPAGVVGLAVVEFEGIVAEKTAEAGLR